MNRALISAAFFLLFSLSSTLSVPISSTLQVDNGEDSDPLVQQRRTKVKEMMLHAWTNYERFAWGANELRPVSRAPHTRSVFGSASAGVTIVDSLDTLLLMGLAEEFEAARAWVRDNFTLDDSPDALNVFETNIRLVGGLLAAFALTDDELFREKAKYVADKMAPAFDTPTGIPFANFDPSFESAHGHRSILSEVGTLHLEFVYLSDVTGDSTYRQRARAIRRHLRNKRRSDGLYPNFIETRSGEWGQLEFSLGGLGDSFYEYLLKAWVQSDEDDSEARDMFDDAMDAILRANMIRTSPGGLLYAAKMQISSYYDQGVLGHKMEHLACFAGGMFALAARRNDSNARRNLEIAEGLTHTCHESYARSRTGLGPEAFSFGAHGSEAKATARTDAHHILRPETVESYFVLWRLTGDRKYRDWAWEALLALERHCRTPHGYSGVRNVDADVPTWDDVQQSFFLAETLKYLFLIFSDDSLLPLNEWVFNTEAHPLPIKRRNRLYRGVE